MKILIFGASGFLGNEIDELFKSKNIEYYTVSRSKKTCNFNIDISNFNDFENLPNHFFDVIINCATVLPGGDFLDNNYLNNIYNTNILGSQNICKWMNSQNSIKKIINCSTLVVANKSWEIDLDETTKTYPTGNHVLYCGSKLMQELIFDTFANSKKIALVQLRFSALYGKSMVWSGIICQLINQAKSTKLINLKNGNKVSVDFLNVIDAAKIILATINCAETGIINAASGKEIFLTDLANIIKENSSESIKIENADEPNFIENRSKININKLKKIINNDEFIDLKTGINQLINL